MGTKELFEKLAGGTSCISMTLPVTLASLLISSSLLANELEDD